MLHHGGLHLLEHEVRRHNRSERLICQTPKRFVDDLQLRSQHRARAGRVNRSQHMLPKATTHWKDRVVIRQNVLILRAGCDRGRGKLPRNFASMRCEDMPNGLDLFRALGKQHTPRDVFHVRVGKLHRDGEARPHPSEFRDVRTQGALAGANEENSRVELFAQCLRNLHHLTGPFEVVADVNLDFIQHEDGERPFCLARTSLVI